ncbi:MAG: hypothetical protein WCS89_02550 [Candidatus Paceibacterota bacterium]
MNNNEHLGISNLPTEQEHHHGRLVFAMIACLILAGIVFYGLYLSSNIAQNQPTMILDGKVVSSKANQLSEVAISNFKITLTPLQVKTKETQLKEVSQMNKSIKLTPVEIEAKRKIIEADKTF